MKNFMIIIEGPMGSGKSTIGELVQKRLKRTAHLSTDKIKWFISDFERGSRDNGITADVMRKMCEGYIENGINLVIAQGFWRKQYIEPYLKLAKKHNLKLFVYQLEAPQDVLVQRVKERGQAKNAKVPVPESKILKNLKTWKDNRYDLGKTFDTSKLSAEEVAEQILKDVSQ